MKKIIFLLLIVSVVFISCKSNKPKDLIVNKWRITDMTTAGEQMPDSLKAKMMQGTMEFTKDGKIMLTGMGDDQSGTYTLSDDGKTLTVTVSGHPETDDVNELSSSKLVITDKAQGGKLTAVPR